MNGSSGSSGLGRFWWPAGYDAIGAGADRQANLQRNGPLVRGGDWLGPGEVNPAQLEVF